MLNNEGLNPTILSITITVENVHLKTMKYENRSSELHD